MQNRDDDSTPKPTGMEGAQTGRPGRLLRLKQVLAIYPVSRSTWYSGIDANIYPKGKRISARAVAWYEDDILVLLSRKDPP